VENHKSKRNRVGNISMKIYEYEDYDDYVRWQTKINKIKLNWVYANKTVIDTISKDRNIAEFIICHGTRSGAEQKFFKNNFPSAYIIGTQISDTASQFEMTIQHDFAIPKKEWIGKADIVYSNSYDHCIDPIKTITTWKEQLSSSGLLYLEYSERDSVCEAADPLLATQKEVEDIIKNQGLHIVKTFSGSKTSNVLVCRRND
jgi:hypothetical protein